MLQFRKIFLRR